MCQPALAAVAMALITFMGLLLRSREATSRVYDRTTAVGVAQAHMITLGEWPDPGAEQGRCAGPERARFPWPPAVTEHRWDA